MKAFALSTALLLSGCGAMAGHQAMVLPGQRPPKNECAIVVCEHRGPGRIDYERDCNKCARSVQDVLQ